jgi:hypothetical protein
MSLRCRSDERSDKSHALLFQQLGMTSDALEPVYLALIGKFGERRFVRNGYLPNRQRARWRVEQATSGSKRTNVTLALTIF